MPISMQTGLHNAQTILHALKLENLPQEIFELQEAMLVLHPNLVTISNIISKNPELLGDFLALCNQILYRDETNKILDAKTAISLIGLKEVEQLFLACYLEKNLPKAPCDYNIIKRCKFSASVASELSHWITNLNRTETYLITFMQDVGAIYLSRYHDPYISEHHGEQCAMPFSAYHRELMHYQTAHTYLGSLIAHHWKLGDLMNKSILLHHSKNLNDLEAYDTRLSNMVALIQLSNAMVTEAFADHYQSPELAQAKNNAESFLKLPKKAIQSGYQTLRQFNKS